MISGFAVSIRVYSYIVLCERANFFARGMGTRNDVSIADALSETTTFPSSFTAQELSLARQDNRDRTTPIGKNLGAFARS